ncbi:hypothetical protein [Tumebacillus flagellatus]|uniref:Uncharacterized protein n=1 Tax=Tumebacillus flagellatus TaxID=1157490 RepID=A0A074LNE2_9BACL|nr:hypothetical protein [Tumebacillus flagellatus]KEO82599.1 hypothetical protein EL26_14535 [Tumebacillus flagellatus]
MKDLLAVNDADRITPEELQALHGSEQAATDGRFHPRQEPLPTLSRAERHKRRKKSLWQKWWGR